MRALTKERGMRGDQHQVVISFTFSQLHVILSDCSVAHPTAKGQDGFIRSVDEDSREKKVIDRLIQEVEGKRSQGMKGLLKC